MLISSALVAVFSPGDDICVHVWEGSGVITCQAVPFVCTVAGLARGVTRRPGYACVGSESTIGVTFEISRTVRVSSALVAVFSPGDDICVHVRIRSGVITCQAIAVGCTVAGLARGVTRRPSYACIVCAKLT